MTRNERNIPPLSGRDRESRLILRPFLAAIHRPSDHHAQDIKHRNTFIAPAGEPVIASEVPNA